MDPADMYNGSSNPQYGYKKPKNIFVKPLTEPYLVVYNNHVIGKRWLIRKVGDQIDTARVY